MKRTEAILEAEKKELRADIEEVTTMLHAHALCIKDMGNLKQLKLTHKSTLKCLLKLQDVYHLPYKKEFPYDPDADVKKNSLRRPGYA